MVINSVSVLSPRQDLGPLMSVGAIGSTAVTFLFDTGCDRSLLSAQLASSLSLPTRNGPPFDVIFGNGTRIPVETYTEVSLQLGPLTVTRSFPVVALFDAADVLLGRDFLSEHDIVISARQRTATFPGAVQLPFTEPPTPIGLRSLLRQKSAAAYLVWVSSTPDNSVRCFSATLGQSSSTPNDRDTLIDDIRNEYSDLFDDGPTQAPAPAMRGVESAEHKIILTDNAQPVKQRDYRRGEAELAALKQLLTDMVRDKVIQPSTSPWSSPVLLVKKSNGSWRFCVDYRALNKVTVKDAYPLPRIEDCLSRLRDATCFTSLDLRSGYHQIPMAADSVPMTAFTTRYGSYEFRVMPFGLCNAPATFQRTMNQLLGDFLDDFVIVYLDDILIYSPTRADHERHVRRVLDRLRDAQFKCNIAKCSFFQDQVDFVGHTVSHNNIAMQTSKLAALRDWPLPATTTQLQRFLGFANYYRRFIASFSKLAKPLTDRAKNSLKRVKLAWTPQMKSAFEDLKKALLDGPVLMIPDTSGQYPFSLQTDASDECIGAVLSQQGRIVDCFSQKLHDAELNYPVRDKELLAIVRALKRYAHLIGNQTVDVYTDHRSLQYLETTKLQGPVPQRRRLDRWWMDTLQHVNMRVIYLPGQHNVAADALSRMHVKDEDVTTFTAAEPVLGEDEDGTAIRDGGVAFVAAAATQANETASAPGSTTVLQLSSDLYPQLVEGYRTDPDWQAVYAGHADPSSKPPRRGRLGIRFRRTELDAATGLLYYALQPSSKAISTSADRRRLVVPQGPVRDLLLAEHHSTPLAGHLGYERQVATMRDKYWWRGLGTDLKDFCARCPKCQLRKDLTTARNGPLQPLDPPSTPFTHVTMDFITGLPKCEGCDAILVVVDRLTRMVMTRATKKAINALDTARLILEMMLPMGGMPLSIVSDRDTRFVASVFQKMCKAFGTNLDFSTAHHPQTDGLTERYNRVLIECLRTGAETDRDNWVQMLPMATYAINSTTHKVTRLTPLFAATGRHPVTPSSLLVQPKAEAFGDDDADSELRRLQSIWQYVADVTALGQEEAAERYDRKVNMVEFKPGDWVVVSIKAVRSPTDRATHSSKLGARCIGPFKVLERVSSNAYRLELPNDVRAHPVINIEHLRRYQLPANAAADFRPAPVSRDSYGEYYLVETLLDKRTVRPKGRAGRPRIEYLVKWMGYSKEEATWEPRASLHDFYIKEFEAARPRT